MDATLLEAERTDLLVLAALQTAASDTHSNSQTITISASSADGIGAIIGLPTAEVAAVLDDLEASGWIVRRGDQVDVYTESGLVDAYAEEAKE